MELLAAILILGGTAGICWVLYGRGSGPTRCIGCGKCAADGRCILTGENWGGTSAENGEKRGNPR